MNLYHTFLISMMIFEVNSELDISQSPVRPKKKEQTPTIFTEHYIKHRFSELFKDTQNYTEYM